MKFNFKRSFIFLTIIIIILNIFLLCMPSLLYATQCTDYAHQKRPDLPALGIAKYWAENASNSGFPVDNTPKAGDIAVFQPGDHDADDTDQWCSGGCGHVAYVESVNSDGTFNISEANFPIGSDYHKRPNLKVESRDQFIHKKEEVSEASSQITEQSTMASESGFFPVVGNWFKDLWGNIINLFTAQAAEPSTTQSVIKASGQEYQQGIQDSFETKQLTTETTAPIPPPGKPSLTSPYNWYQSLGTPPLLMWQGDNNSTSYYVIVNSSNTGNVESGWINSNSWKPNLPNQNYIYSWKVKAKNSQGVEGPWSDESHFSTASTILKFEGDILFDPLSPSSADTIKIFASTTGWGGVGITLRVSVNTASDGSTDGEWKILKELGVPKFNENDAPIWNTKEWHNGTYRVRVEAKGPDDQNWQNPTVAEALYTLIEKEYNGEEVDSIEPSDTKTQKDYEIINKVENLVIYKSYDIQTEKNVFVIMNIDGSDKNVIYLDNFLVDYGKIIKYGESKYNLKNANSPFLSSDGRFIICNESGTWYTHILDIAENSLKTFEYIDEKNELNSGSIRRDPCFSPDINLVALGGIHSKYTNSDVQLCTFLTNEVENANLNVLTNLDSWVNNPRFSPDGSKIIFNTDQSDIIIIDADGNNMINFTEKYGYEGVHPDFSPDFKKIGFMYYENGRYNIATVNLDGKDFKIIYKSKNGYCESPSFSSDGTRIIFSAPFGDPTGHYRDIFSIDINGNNLVNLTNSAKIDDHEPECVY